MFRTRLTLVTKVARKQFSTAAEQLPESYSGGVQLMHWGMGGAMLASVGKTFSANHSYLDVC